MCTNASQVSGTSSSFAIPVIVILSFIVCRKSVEPAKRILSIFCLKGPLFLFLCHESGYMFQASKSMGLNMSLRMRKQTTFDYTYVKQYGIIIIIIIMTTIIYICIYVAY